MTSEVTDLITALRNGTMSLDEVARRFRERPWPRTKGTRPLSYIEMAAASERDPEPYVPGSVDDVTSAYDRGQLTREQYRVLIEAAAESLRAESERSGDADE